MKCGDYIRYMINLEKIFSESMIFINIVTSHYSRDWICDFLLSHTTKLDIYNKEIIKNKGKYDEQIKTLLIMQIERFLYLILWYNLWDIYRYWIIKAFCSRIFIMKKLY